MHARRWLAHRAEQRAAVAFLSAHWLRRRQAIAARMAADAVANAAATVLSAVWRGRQARVEARRAAALVSAATTVAARWRAVTAVRVFRQQRNAALLLQVNLAPRTLECD